MHQTFINPSWCPECGPDVSTDEDGCCRSCGATAFGAGATAAHALRARVAELEAALATRYWEGIRDDNTALRARVAALEAVAREKQGRIDDLEDRINEALYEIRHGRVVKARAVLRTDEEK